MKHFETLERFPDRATAFCPDCRRSTRSGWRNYGFRRNVTAYPARCVLHGEGEQPARAGSTRSKVSSTTRLAHALHRINQANPRDERKRTVEYEETVARW